MRYLQKEGLERKVLAYITSSKRRSQKEGT